MVRRETDGSKALRLRKTNPWVMLGMLGILIATIVVCGWLAFFDKSDDINIEEAEIENNNGQITEKSAYKDSENIEVEPKKIDFQPTVEEWAASVNGNKSVLIYDLDRDEVAGAYNSDEKYSTASLYKLFVVYEGYRRVDSDEWKGDELAGSTGHNIKECLDLAIRESHSPCAEAMWDKIGEDTLDEIIEQDYEIANSDISEFVSTSEDIAKIMKKYYYHRDIKDEALLAQMKDSLLNQPATEYDWRQGLPSGFSDAAKVYNKVGWEYNADEGHWDIYHDAAIVEFSNENRNYVVVVMTNGVPYQKIRDFGKKFEQTYLDNI